MPAPPGFDFKADGFHTSDGDTGIYFRPDSGNHILVGSEDPDGDPELWVENPKRLSAGDHRGAVGGPGLPPGTPDPDLADPD